MAQYSSVFAGWIETISQFARMRTYRGNIPIHATHVSFLSGIVESDRRIFKNKNYLYIFSSTKLGHKFIQDMQDSDEPNEDVK